MHEVLQSLQLTISRLDGFCLFLGFSDLAALPANGCQSFSENGVRVMITGIRPIGVHGAQILDLQFKERLGKLLGISKSLGKCI